MANTQKPDFVFRPNGRVHLNRRGPSVHSTTGSRGVRISGSNGGYTMFRGSVKGTGYPFHSPVSPSLPLPCVTMCQHFNLSVPLAPNRRRTINFNCVCVCERERERERVFLACIRSRFVAAHLVTILFTCFLRFAVQTTDDTAFIPGLIDTSPG